MPPPTPSSLLSTLYRPSITSQCPSHPLLRLPSALQRHPQLQKALPNLHPQHHHLFSTAPKLATTLMQVLKSRRQPKRARHPVSPALVNRPQMKAVCLLTRIQNPKKPNSAERKVAKVRLSNGKVVTGYINGEGHNLQQHSVVLVRGGRAQDCPGVRYRLVRGAMDFTGVPSRRTARSKYGTKKPKSSKV